LSIPWINSGIDIKKDGKGRIYGIQEGSKMKIPDSWEPVNVHHRGKLVNIGYVTPLGYFPRVGDGIVKIGMSGVLDFLRVEESEK
jgi:hypothetical protein